MTKTTHRTSAAKAQPRLEELVNTAVGAHDVVTVTLLYEDSKTRAWAREAFERMEKAAGPGRLRPSWWRLSDLKSAGVLAGAVTMALRANLLVVALRGSEMLPLPFYLWVNSWLPNRSHGGGALIGLLGAPSSNGHAGDREILRDYLRQVAEHGGMEFRLETRRTAAPPLNLEWLEALAPITAAAAILN